MSSYIARRLLALIPVLLVVGVVVFLLIHLTPGDPAAVMLGPEASEAQVQELRQELGLDQPVWVQFFAWFGELLRGNLGDSMFLQQPVAQAIWQRLGPTGSLTALALAIALLIGLPAGILGAWYRDTPLDQLIISGALLGVSIPNFWLGLILIGVFAVGLMWFPVAGYTSPSDSAGGWFLGLMLPAVALGSSQAGLIARMLRDGMLDVLDQDFIRTARSKGLIERAVVVGHALPNAMIPTLTVIGTSVGTLLGGAVVTERVFAIPGIGSLIVDSISRRDYPVVQGAVLFIAMVYVLVNLAIDLAYAVIDPRIRYD